MWWFLIGSQLCSGGTRRWRRCGFTWCTWIRGKTWWNRASWKSRILRTKSKLSRHCLDVVLSVRTKPTEMKTWSRLVLRLRLVTIVDYLLLENKTRRKLYISKKNNNNSKNSWNLGWEIRTGPPCDKVSWVSPAFHCSIQELFKRQTRARSITAG